MKFMIHDYKRNFIVLFIASVLNFAFALEKFLLWINSPLSDFAWFCIYGGNAFLLSIVAFWDYKSDCKEGISTSVERVI